MATSAHATARAWAAAVVATFREYSVAQAYEATVHPRWAELKDQANQALKDGDLDGAIEGYACALSIVDASNLAALFDALGSWPADSAGAKLAAAEEDIAPLIREYLPGPVLSRGEPNRPAAVCLANRASALLQAGRTEAAVADARAATLACPEYIKGHHRLRQALLATAADAALEPRNLADWGDGKELMLKGEAWEHGRIPTAGTIEATIRGFQALSEEEPCREPHRGVDCDGRHPPDTWLGFRLVMLLWLPPSVNLRGATGEGVARPCASRHHQRADARGQRLRLPLPPRAHGGAPRPLRTCLPVGRDRLPHNKPARRPGTAVPAGERTPP